MSIALSKPSVAELDDVLGAMCAWQRDGLPVQLHPGDIGWQWRFGAEETAAALRTWSRDARVLAVGMVDGPGLVRLAISPDAADDDELARRLVADVATEFTAAEVRFGDRVRQLLAGAGWVDDELWTPLVRDLAEPVEDSGLRIETVGPERVSERTAVQRAAFERSTFTDDRWRAMAAGPAFAAARDLLAYDEHGVAVAAATVWSAGPGRPGLLEPVGVHRDHQGRRYGTAITLAAASALREMGASSATVCTRSANVRAVATYRSGGFRQLPDVPDLRRP